MFQSTPASMYEPLVDDSGEEVFCGRGPDRQDCPDGYSCAIDATDRYAVCCPNGPTPPEPTPTEPTGKRNNSH